MAGKLSARIRILPMSEYRVDQIFMKTISVKTSLLRITQVFRTYNASETLQRELAKFDTQVEDSDKLDDTKVMKFYNEANRQVFLYY